VRSAALAPAARSSREPHFGIRTLAAGALLGAFLLGPRAYIVGWRDLEWLRHEPLKTFAKIVLSGAYDVAYAAGLTGIALIVVAVLRGRRLAAIAYYAFVVLAMVSLLAAIANIKVVRMLGQPLSYSWLYYADFLRGADARAGLRESMSWPFISALLAVGGVFVLASLMIGRWAAQRMSLVSHRARVARAVALSTALAVYLAGGHYYLTSRSWPPEKLVNPAYAFLRSWLTTARVPAIFTMATRAGDGDFAPARASAPPAMGDRPAAQHVVLFVLESTPAEYLGAYGSRYGVTPALDGWARRGAVFENIYAHAPASTTALVSILCSAYPWISYRSAAQEKPDIALESLPAELARAGFETAFFHGSDLSYQRAGEFVRARGFDFVQDYTARPTARPLLTSDRWPFLNGSHDVSTVESVIEWLTPRRKRRTFTMVWTMMTHYPYFTAGEMQRFGPEENLFNQYLNALRSGDAAFGTLAAWLEQQGWLDDTLLVIVGDHGEAFGRHGQFAHASKIYEENIHVPLMLIGPTPFATGRYPTVGGLVDVAPTITELLGRPAAATWQGRSLLAHNRPDRTYFFAPWSDYLFGSRDRSTKFIFNASKNTYELYDLSADPLEQRNLAGDHPAEIRDRIDRLAAWVQYQNRMYGRLMN
jgi:arylsulfatase A-like enzyme